MKAVYLLTSLVALGGLTGLAQKPLTPQSGIPAKSFNHSVCNTASDKAPAPAIWNPDAPGIPQMAYNRFAVNEGLGKTTRSADQEVLLSQDFSLITEGSETDIVPISLTEGTFTSVDDLMLSSEYMGSEGWWGFGVYAAGGQVALAIPNYGGILNTPLMDMYGKVTINIRAKLREGTTFGFFWLTCQKTEDGNLLGGSTVNNLSSSVEGSATNLCRLTDQEWQDFSITVLNPYEGESWFQINAATYNATGILIDHIEIVRDSDFAMAPTGLRSYDFNEEGFTATWTPGANNSSYLLTLMEQKPDGEDQSLSVDFDGIKVDDDGHITQLDDLKGVEIYLTDNNGTLNEGFEESGAIVLTSDNDGILLPDTGNPIVSASLYMHSLIDPTSSGLLYVMAGSNNGYPILAGTVPLNYAIDGETFDLTEYISQLGACTYLMFQPFGLGEDESLIIDNLQWTVAAPMKEEIVFEDKPFDTNVAVLCGLNPANEYFFAVKGVSPQGTVSTQSEQSHALGCPAPKVKAATDVELEKGSYTANWEPSVKAVAYEVSNFEMRRMSEDIEDYSVFFDDFENASDPYGYGMELEGESFDGLADNNGWTSQIGIYSESSIGAYYGADVASPYLSLGHDNGRFKVKTQLSGYPGARIILQCNTSSFQVATIPMEGDPNELISEEFEFTFEDGTDFTRLLFYAGDFNAFLIQDIEVLQNVSKDDLVYTFQDSKLISGHDSNSCEITGLTPSTDFDYAFTVTAYGNYLGTTYSSDPSEACAVNFGTNAVAAVSGDYGQIRMFVKDGSLWVSLPYDANISVYDILGKKVKETTGRQGINTINLDSDGMYIVKVGETSKKIIVKL